MLARYRLSSTKDRMRETVSTAAYSVATSGAGPDRAPVLSEADLEELLEICGVAPAAKSLDLEAIAQALMDTICQPKVPPHRVMRTGVRQAWQM